MFMRKIRAQASLELPLPHLERSGPALRTTSIMVGRMSAPSRIGAVDADPAMLAMHMMAGMHLGIELLFELAEEQSWVVLPHHLTALRRHLRS